MFRPILFRCGALLASLALSLFGSIVFLQLAGADGVDAIELVRWALVALAGFWLVWGSAAAVLGVFVWRPRAEPTEPAPLVGRTVILVPIYNEDAAATFSRVAAMNRSLIAEGVAERFHFAVLSDTQAVDCIAQEAIWFQRLLEEPASAGRMFYRRRERNVGRKAGNIEDFISRSGAAYDYALILDADSLMEGSTIAAMARRMEADPGLGLLQTVPRVINAQTLFGRSIQFSASYLSPTFARGAALMQGREGPYWGHNAIVRVRAFAASCGLPELSGTPPFGGHILSHDYVEAALLSRAGWKVEVDPWLPGSYEEGPDNLIEYAKRDRRWCQGNLQHGRLIAAPGLKLWSRFTFIQGIMAYLAAPLWLALLIISVVGPALPEPPPILLNVGAPLVGTWTLGLGVAVALLLPKLLILVRGMFDGQNRRFGGTPLVALNVLGEIVISTLMAPILLMLQSRAVAQVLLGLDGGWPPTRRGQNWVSLADALRASWWIVATAGLALGSTLAFLPSVALWVAPVMLPALLAPLLISATSRPLSPRPLAFRTDIEQSPTPVLLMQQSIFAAWSPTAATTRSEASGASIRTPDHVAVYR
jgi:membrane glycosyltransferase